MQAVLGIDIAKASFDGTLLDEQGGKRRRSGSNKAGGFKQLHRWVQQHTQGQVHVCLEATRVYWEPLAEYLHDQGYQVSVVNPARIKGYSLSQLRRSKTDPLDGDVIADFCRAQQPALWHPPSPQQKKLRALVRHLQALKKSRPQQHNRLTTCRDPEVKASIETILEVIETEMSQVQQRLRDFFDDQPDLKANKKLLETIPGIGDKTATHILAEMYDLDQYDSAKAAAADVGLTAAHYRSGTSVRRRSKMSRMGKAAIRGALHFPAITAIEHNPLVRQLAQRLQARGKHNGVIRVAAMRKLIHLAYGVLKHNQPFDPAFAT